MRKVLLGLDKLQCITRGVFNVFPGIQIFWTSGVPIINFIIREPPKMDFTSL